MQYVIARDFPVPFSVPALFRLTSISCQKYFAIKAKKKRDDACLINYATMYSSVFLFLIHKVTFIPPQKLPVFEWNS